MNSSQPANTVATNQQHVAVTVVSAVAATGRTRFNTYYQKKLLGVGIAEIVLGFLAFIFGAILAGLAQTGPYFYFNRRSGSVETLDLLTFGEGIWCGIPIICVGIMGIYSSRTSASKCLIVTTYISSFALSFFTGIAIILSAISALNGSTLIRIASEDHFLVISSMLAVTLFIATVYLIITTTYICATLRVGWCANGCKCCGESTGSNDLQPGGQIVITEQRQEIVYVQNSVVAEQAN